MIDEGSRLRTAGRAKMGFARGTVLAVAELAGHEPLLRREEDP